MTSSFEIPGFEIQEELGRGGFGVVFKAYEPALRRHVAIKVLHTAAKDSDVLRRFQRECGIVGSLRAHPHIVTVYHAGQTSTGYPFLVMEYLPGRSLAERAPIPADEVRDLGLKLSSALDSAHRSGVKHLDIKPGNVMFNADDEPVLVDFGIAVMTGDSTTTSRSVTASVGYAAPEVLEGKRGTEATDIYGVGATLFAALSGTTPFHDPELTLTAIIARVATVPIGQFRPDGVPDALWSVIEKSMAKVAADRFGSMAELHAALLSDQVVAVPLGGSDVTARGVVPAAGMPTVADAPTDRIVPSSRRRWLPAAVAAVLLAGGTAAAFALTGDSGANPKALDLPTSVAPGGPVSSSSPSPSGKSTPPIKPSSKPPTRPASSAGLSTPGQPPPTPGGTTVVVLPPPPPAPANRPPTISGANQTSDEQASVSATFAANDPDGDGVTISVSGLPAGLSANNGQVSGTISYSAASVTTDRRVAIRSQQFTVTVTAIDSRNARTVKTFSWTVNDTHRLMPNYIGKEGCGGCQGLPDVAAISTPGFLDGCDPNGDGGHIVKQSVGANSVIRWGQPITYWYGYKPSERPNCQPV